MGAPDGRPALALVVAFEGLDLPQRVSPDDLPALVEACAPRMVRFPGRETHAAEGVVRESYGLPKPPDLEAWKRTSWVDRARDLVRDGWNKVRGLFQRPQEPATDAPEAGEDPFEGLGAIQVQNPFLEGIRRSIEADRGRKEAQERAEDARRAKAQAPEDPAKDQDRKSNRGR